MLQETTSTARKFVQAHKSQRKAAEMLGVPQPLLSDVLRGRADHVSAAQENKLRIALGLAPVARIEVDPCPDCGSVHTGRCNGRAVEVRPVRRRKPVHRIADYPARALAAAIIHRQEYQP